MTSTRPSRGIAAAAVLAAVTLAGCGAHPGAAAVVDGEEISESYLAEAVTDFNAVTGQQVDGTAMLSTLIVTPLVLDIGQEYGVAASDDEAATLLDQQAEAAGVSAPASYGEGVLDTAKIAIVTQDLTMVPDAAQAQQEIAQRLANAEVEVSPRYGEANETGAIVPAERPWLATPAVPEMPAFG